MEIAKPSREAAPAYAWKYIDQLPQSDLLKAFNSVFNDTVSLIEKVSSARENFAYAEGKWTIKQLLEHITDTERILMYRALRFSRQDATPLEGFDEDHYAFHSNATNRSLAAVLNEYKAVRASTVSLYHSLTPAMLDFQALANNQQHSARSLGWFAAGHNAHHSRILRERYF